ncbi:MAG: MFS transporter [Dehalococcoidia bacterium]
MQDTSKTQSGRGTVIGTLTAVHAVDISVILLLGLLLPDIAEDLDLSPSQQGWLGSAATISLLFLAIPTNLWISRYRPWRVASLAFLAISGFIFLQAWAPVFALILIARVGMGLAFSQGQVATTLLIQQWSTRRQVPFTNGVMISGSDVVLGLAFFITPFLVSWLDGWRNTLYLWGGLSLVGALAWVVLGRERVTPEYLQRMDSQFDTPLSSIFRYKELWILGMGIFGGMVMESAFSVFWPTFARQELLVSASLVGFALGLFFFAAAPSELLVTVVPILTRHRLMVLVVTALLTVGAHIGLLFTGSTSLVLLLSIVRGLSISYFPIIITMVYQLPDIKPREVAVGLSFVYTCIDAGTATGPLLVGFLQEATGDLKLSLMATVFFPLTLVLAAFFLRTRLPRQELEATLSA